MPPFAGLRQRLSQWRSDARLAAGLGDLWRLRKPRGACESVNLKFNGRVMPVRLRTGTMDAQLARQILCEDSEYRLPIALAPKVIVDAGANIGLTSLYYGALYPEARIYCFEPLPQNVELLRYNLQSLGDRATVIAKGLGHEEGSFDYHPSNDARNFGGGSFTTSGADAARSTRLPITTLKNAMHELNIDKIDLLKLDVEGFELSVLRGLAPKDLSAIDLIIGELHGVNDFELMTLLASSHKLSFNKTLRQGCYPFAAARACLLSKSAQRVPQAA